MRVLDAYSDWMRSWGASQATIDVRIGTVAPLLEQWGGIHGITKERIEAWLVEPRRRIPKDKRECKPATRATYHAHIKSLCDWLVATDLLTVHPMQGMRAPNRPNAVPRPLSEVEAERATAAATGDLRVWLMLAMDAGLRAHEIAKIRGEDVAEDFIYLRGKGGVAAMIPTHPDLWAEALQRPRHGWWFPAETPSGHIGRERISKYVGDHFRKQGIPHGSIHRARHLFATRLLRRGVNIRVVQQLMRHANVKTTAGYTAVDEDEMRAAILRLPGADAA